VNPAVTEGGYQLVPFVRVVSTDLNFTVALAIIAVIAVQVVGIRAQGMGISPNFGMSKHFSAGRFSV
jgi:F0F1-type ATP synthase membrane subunit a